MVVSIHWLHFLENRIGTFIIHFLGFVLYSVCLGLLTAYISDNLWLSLFIPYILDDILLQVCTLDSVWPPAFIHYNSEYVWL